MPDVKIIKTTVPGKEYKKTLKVAAYCRVSTQSEEQDGSLRDKFLQRKTVKRKSVNYIESIAILLC